MSDPSGPSSPGGAGLEDPPARGLGWLAELLWSDERLRVTFDLEAPEGFRTLERFAIVPGRTRARMLLPLARGAARAAVEDYNALRPARTQLARTGLGFGIRAGLGLRLLRSRLSVHVARETAPEELPAILLAQRLKQILGEDEVVTATGVGRPGPYRKPVLHALTPRGRSLGFAKVGWNEVTGRLVRREAAALSAVADAGFDAVGSPRLLHQGPWHGHDVAVSAPMPLELRRYAPMEVPPPLSVTWAISELGGTASSALGDAPYWDGVRGRVVADRESGPADLADALDAHTQLLEARFGDTELRFGFWHGDWSPWNMGLVGDRLWVWDWEHSGEGVPVGLDLAHFSFQLAFIAGRRDVREAVERIRTEGAGRIERLGFRRAAARLVADLYVVEITLRYVDAMAAGAGRNPRFYPAIVPVLHEETERLRAVSRT